MPESAWKSRLGYVSMAAAGVGAVTLAFEMYEFRQFKNQMRQMIPAYSGDRPPPVEATAKEWLIIGRQSPGYVRGSSADKHPKYHILNAIAESALSIRQLGTALDNEKHYDLFVGSDFIVERCAGNGTSPLIIVKPEQMRSTDMHDINIHTSYEVNFARKQGFADWSQKSPLYHSALALRLVPPGYAVRGAVTLTGDELKSVLIETNLRICHSQHCDLFRSNCYSATIFALAQVIKEIDKRPRSDENDELIENASRVLAGAAGENLGRGVANNSVVKAQLRDVLAIQINHGLLHAPTKGKDSDTDALTDEKDSDTDSSTLAT